MAAQNTNQDPLEFVRSMWGNMGFNLPGMVTPTLDVNELDKRITDMKAVEGWLKMNLNMLQMTIQGLEMQRTTLAAVQAMSKVGKEGNDAQPAANPFAGAMWPWNIMPGATPPAQPGSAAQAEAPKPKAGNEKK